MTKRIYKQEKMVKKLGNITTTLKVVLGIAIFVTFCLTIPALGNGDCSIEIYKDLSGNLDTTYVFISTVITVVFLIIWLIARHLYSLASNKLDYLKSRYN